MWRRVKNLYRTILEATTRRLAKALDEADAASALYSCEVGYAGGVDPPVALRSLRGIVCAYVLAGSQPILCVYWRSQQDFMREEAAFHGALQGSEQRDVLWRHGFVHGYVAPRRKIPWYTIITTILAIIGAFESARLLVRHVFQRPDVLLTAGRAGAINYFPEQQLFESFRLTSRAATEQRVVIEKVQLQRANVDVAAATYEPQVMTSLREGQSEAIQASVPLPAEVGSYGLTATVKTKAGWLRDTRSISYSMPVKIWSPVPRARFERWSPISDTVALAQYRLEVGYAAPAGLDCIAVAIGTPPEIAAIIPQMVGTYNATGLDVSGTGTSKVVSLRWTTRPFADFTANTVSIIFEATEPVDWNALRSDKFELNCSPHPPDSRQQ